VLVGQCHELAWIRALCSLKQHLPTRRENCFGVAVDLNSDSPAICNFGQWKPYLR
jgi:hypothetical protein